MVVIWALVAVLAGANGSGGGSGAQRRLQRHSRMTERVVHVLRVLSHSVPSAFAHLPRQSNFEWREATLKLLRVADNAEMPFKLERSCVVSFCTACFVARHWTLRRSWLASRMMVVLG